MATARWTPHPTLPENTKHLCSFGLGTLSLPPGTRSLAEELRHRENKSRARERSDLIWREAWEAVGLLLRLSLEPGLRGP